MSRMVVLTVEYLVGEKVGFRVGSEIEAVVIGYRVHPDGAVSYECSWFQNGENRTGMFGPVELVAL